MSKESNMGRKALSVAVVSTLTSSPLAVVAQPDVSEQVQIEEVLVLGRLESAAQSIVSERMESETVTDILGAEQMERIGDSSVAEGLKRVPGLTLVNGQFIYVRGLGERYSSSLLNGASVPSPDLTRNVLPLDIFPASVLHSVSVTKAFTPDQPAAFGGGNINIRTRGIPDGPVFSVSLGASIDSGTDQALDYRGSSDDWLGSDDGHRALDPAINQALNSYYTSIYATEGSLSPQAIEATYERSGAAISRSQAEAINASLATTLNRDLDISSEKPGVHGGSFDVDAGNVFFLNDEISFGFLTSLSYDNSIRTQERVQRVYADPTQEFDDEIRTTRNVSITGALNLGVNWLSEHEITVTNLFLRNTDDEVSITNKYTQTSPFGSGQGGRNWDYRFEQRELTVNQVSGEHALGYETLQLLGLQDSFEFLYDLKLTWFHSDSRATSDIPGETNILGRITRDVTTGEITSEELALGLRMVDVRHTELEDNVTSSGFNLEMPFYLDDWEITLSGGGKFDTKTRTFRQLDLSLGSTNPAIQPTLSGDISDVLSDANITNPAYNYDLVFQSGLSRSYLAATTTDAFYGQLDLMYDFTWRLAIGARWEEYKQFSGPWAPYGVGSQLLLDFSNPVPGQLPPGVFYEEEFYPSIALTYSKQGFWADDFNLRFAVSETVVRPDLREVSDASYLDPQTDVIVRGNPDVVPTDLKNYDARAEWFFGNGDSFSVSLFYKQLGNPIEYFQNPGAEDTITATIENAESGETQGVEIEFLKSLDFLGDFGNQLFLSGNLTLAESEIDVGNNLTVAATNRIRPLNGASEYVVNLQLGYDSNDYRHAATLAYNLTGERIFAAGSSTEPDAYEQPFDALDLTYSYFPTDRFTIKLSVRNLLGDDQSIRQGKVALFEQTVGTSYSLSAKYAF